MQVARSTTAEFEAEFTDSDGVPLVADNPAIQPTVVIKDPAGMAVANGVGRAVGSGKYTFNWFVPETAEVNLPDTEWVIEWFFVTINRTNKQVSQNFSVIDQVDPDAEQRKWTYLTRIGTSERLLIRQTKKPFSVGIDILDNSDKLIFTTCGTSKDLADATVATPVAQRKIAETKDEGGRYVYFFDTEPLGLGEYLVFWKVRETEISVEEHIQQMLRVPEMQFWRLLQPMRILIDKLQKRVGWIQSYHDSDIYEYLLRGVDSANMVQPTTNWTLGSIPIRHSRGAIEAVLLFAVVHALGIAQQTLEIELNFDHSGQTVGLNYNHDYSGVLSNINDLLGRFAESKQHLYRIAHGPGFVGVRPKNWRFTQRVWRVDGWGFGSPYDVSSLLTSVGLG